MKVKNIKVKNIYSKNQLLKYKFQGILIGDLIYDGYLREKDKVTPDIQSAEFNNYFKKALNLTLFWINYFKNNDVKALIQSHNVYLLGIPGRIACHLNIKVFNASCYEVYRLTKKKPLKFSYFEDYPKEFKKLPKKIQNQGLKEARKYLNDRIKGKVDQLTLRSRAIKDGTFERKLEKNYQFTNKPKILIAAHDFTDAPHVHSNIAFEDFYEWINFLGKYANNSSKYEWLIKLHPVDYEANYDKMVDIIKRYKNLKLLDQKINHLTLLSEKVKCVLTVYGSISHEYPLFNIPVINAGNNPHKGYNFSYHALSKKKYLYYLNNIENLKINKKKLNKIHEFYFMNFMVDFNLFERLKYNEEVLNSNEIFKYFFKTKMSKKIDNYLKLYKKFIKSNSRRMIKYNVKKIRKFFDLSLRAKLETLKSKTNLRIYPNQLKNKLISSFLL